MSGRSAWSDPSIASLEDVARMAAHLEDRAQRADQAQVNRAVVDSLAPQPGERLLEVGSGSGVICRLVAPHVAPGGEVVGLDISPQFTTVAREYAAGAELGHLTRFETGQAEDLPYPQDSFAGAFALRLLMHAADPDLVVRELARVVRPGGRLVLADWDFGTVAVSHPDRELTRRILNWRTDHHGGDDWSGRKLLGRARQAGLQDIHITPLAVASQDDSSALTLSLWRAAEVAREKSIISPLEHDAWVEELKAQIERGDFFTSITYFILKAYL